jgi:hypothetical protein
VVFEWRGKLEEFLDIWICRRMQIQSGKFCGVQAMQGDVKSCINSAGFYLYEVFKGFYEVGYGLVYIKSQ